MGYKARQLGLLTCLKARVFYCLETFQCAALLSRRMRPSEQEPRLQPSPFRQGKFYQMNEI